MTHGETYYLHCPMCGEKLAFQMQQNGQESLSSSTVCDCGQDVFVTDHREMNVDDADAPFSQLVHISISRDGGGKTARGTGNE